MAYYSALKEWNSDTCSNMEEPWKHYAKYKKLDTEKQLFYDSTYMRYLEQSNWQRQR